MRAPVESLGFPRAEAALAEAMQISPERGTRGGERCWPQPGRRRDRADVAVVIFLGRRRTAVPAGSRSQGCRGSGGI